MLVTALLAIVLAVGRVVISRFGWAGTGDSGQLNLIWGFTAVANACFVTPIFILSAFQPRVKVLAVATIGMVALVSMVEEPLLNALSGPNAAPRLNSVFWWSNAFQAAWILAVFWLLRGAGYSWETKARTQHR